MALVVKDIGGTVALQSVFDAQTFQASSTANNADTLTGNTIDRNAFSRRYLSVKVGLAIAGALGTATSGLNFAGGSVGMQHSSDGSSWANYSTDRNGTRLYYGTSSGGLTAGATAPAASTSTSTGYRGVVDANFDISRARRYIRFTFAPNVGSTSSGSANTMQVAGIAVLGGADLLPAT